uniref:RBD domain-containing protein n=1 Tax=Mola mola TaxID=94237 RepID=A0A3Q4AYW5_MOLML
MASSGMSVTVLTPNGRRQTVKVFPNTPLLQVLEDVCKKHGFNPDDHGLKFQRTTVDLTLPWRFANLPNNAKLEMVTSARKQAVADTQVRIALQMGDGSRLQDSFSCGQSLWEVVTHFPQIRCVHEHTLVLCMCECAFVHLSFGAEALKTATLKSLGLTGGSAIIRFLLKNSKTQGEEDGREPVETDTMPTAPVAKDTAPCLPSQPDPAKSQPTERHPEPPPTSATITFTVQQEEDSKSQRAYQPKVESSERPEDDGEKAGPSGLNAHPVSSSPTAPSAPFIPFSGGGQRLGGPVAGAGGRSLSSSASSSLSALTAAIESPKAKKAKSSHSSSTKVSLITTHQESPKIYFVHPPAVIVCLYVSVFL